MENVYSALRVVAMPAHNAELDKFLAGSPHKAVEAEVKRAKAESKKAKSTSIAKGVTVLHVSRCGFKRCVWIVMLLLLFCAEIS